MGLAVAGALCKRGASVEVFDADDRLGGMSAHFDFDGTRVERYYHFVCGPDLTTIDYLRELGLEDRLRWVDTRMGFYLNGTLHDWGTPQAMWRFPGLSLWQKLRYGFHVLRAKRITDWRPYDGFTSTEWLTRWIGPKAYDVMWRSLFRYKFYEHENSLSAAWLGTRIKRIALSRSSIFQERLGYLEGGSEMLLDALARQVEALGGAVRLSAPVEAVLTEGAGAAQRVCGVRVGGQELPFDAVVSTAPLPYLPGLVPDLPADERAKIEAIVNVAVVCVILKLKRPFTLNFWLNINDPRLEIPGLIEYTNLNPLDGSSIVYAPFYMPQTHPKYGQSTEAFVEETLACMQSIRPDFDRADVVAATASRYRYAQTVCSPGFFEALPPMKSGLSGFFMADTSYYYPEDRSISESLRTGELLARTVAESLMRPGPFPAGTSAHDRTGVAR